MAHGQLHPRGDNEPDVELHLEVRAIAKVRVKGRGVKGGLRVLRIVVQEIAEGGKGRIAELDEPYVDYRDELKVGKMNVFYVPLSMAREAGMVA